MDYVSDRGVTWPTIRSLRQLCYAGCVVLVGCAGDAGSEASDPLATVGCPSGSIDGGLLDASTDTSDAAAPDADAVDAGEPVADAGPVADPNQPSIESVIATGTGCPRGTWSSAITPDGRHFTIDFESYALEVNPTQFQATQDCTLSIKLRPMEGVSVAVRGLRYAGYALLEPGVVLEQTALYGFQGTSVSTTNQNRTILPKPPETSYDADFVFRDAVETSDLVWSPCGITRELNIRTRLSLKNGQYDKPRANGYAVISRFDSARELELVTKRCAGTTDP